MRREYHQIHSDAVGRPLEVLSFGHAGKPMLVFPCSAGRFFDWENFGMVETVVPFIEAGKLQVYCVDSLDRESWYAGVHPADKARRANDYDWAITHDIVPFVKKHSGRNGKIMTHGCSFGAYHAANFWLKHPDLFDLGLLLSGNYSIAFCVGDYRNDDIYYNDPLMYLPNLNDEHVLQRMRDNLLIIVSGQGAWEDWLGEAREMAGHLAKRNVPHLLDIWGYDVNHDWPWWKRQIVYHLEKLDAAQWLTDTRPLDNAAVTGYLKRFARI